MTIQQAMIDEAKKLLDTPYKDKGRDEGGIDCAGLLIVVAHRLGISDYDSLNYARRPDPVELKREMNRISSLELLRNKWEWQNGDIGVFRTATHPVHLGLLEVENGRWYVIHSWAPARKVVRTEVTREDLNDPRMRLTRVYRYKG